MCPLAGKKKIPVEEAMSCECCTHQSYSGLWSREDFCDNGQSCIYRSIPQHTNNLWWLVQHTMKAEGFGGLSTDVEKFKFWVGDIFSIEKKDWGAIMVAVDEMFSTYLNLSQGKNKKRKIQFTDGDVAQLKELGNGN